MVDAVRATSPCQDSYLPRPAVVVERRTEGPNVVTLRVRLTNPDASHAFVPGQFNMLHGPDGDVPISIVAGNDAGYFEHCIRGVGNASRELTRCRKGDTIGLRGPFGRGCWPILEARGRDVLVLSGGIGCAAVASAIDHVTAHRAEYGRLSILQGVTTDASHLYDERYSEWMKQPDTQVLIASMEAGPEWRGRKGLVTDLLSELAGLCASNTVAMVCGPEVMVRPTVERLKNAGIPSSAIYLSLERNMQCGIAHCGHCQLGRCLVCRDGPVFSHAAIEQSLAAAP